MRRIKLMLLTFLVSIFSPLFAVEVVDGTGVAGGGNPFAQSIAVKAFDRYTGDIYLGTDTANDELSIAKAGRDDTAFTGIADDTGAQVGSNYMGILNNAGAGTTHVAVRDNTSTPGLLKVIESTGGTPYGRGARGTAAAGPGNICDTAGAAAGNSVANAFRQIHGGYSSSLGYGIFFLRVNSTDGVNAVNSGILGLKLTGTGNPLVRVGNWATNQYATRVDGRISGATDNNNFLRASSASSTLATAPIVNDIYWDPTLETLFVGGSVTTVAAADFQSAILTVTVKDGHLGTNGILPVDVNAAANNDTTIFATNCTGGRQDPRILKIRPMHTSTGKVYLIVNGGIATADSTVGNQIWALRYNTTTGTVVVNDKDETALTTAFVRSGNATASKNLDGGNGYSLNVGGAYAPIDASSITDMEVIGDTVYISTAADRDGTNDPGVWSSTAMFDKDGVIIGWTAWERVFTSVNTNAYDTTKMFEIDAVNNKIWQIPYTNDTYVRRMKWDTSGYATTSLPKALEDTFASLTYPDVTCILDLPNGIPGIAATSSSDNSFVIFGGYEIVVFARTKYGTTNAVTTDFSAATAYRETTLSGAGTVRALGYSRNNEDATNGYFFAGTDLGLWVYATTADGTGFNGNTGLTALNATPFDTSHSWQHMASTLITGAVTRIESDGTYVYVVEQDVSSPNGTIVSKLWRIFLDEDITTMEASCVCIAKSGKDEIPANTIFTGFELISDILGTSNVTGRGQDITITTSHKGLLSTNAGVFQSSVVLSDFITVDSTYENPNQPNCWDAISSNRAYRSLHSTKRVPTTYPLNQEQGRAHKTIANAFVDDSRGYNYFQNSSLYQFGSSVNLHTEDTGENTRTEAGVRISYTNRDMASGTSALTYLNNRAMAFWTDGGRRFYTRLDADDYIADPLVFNMLNSLPFDALQWNMSSPYGSDDTVGKKIYWVENISGLGIILAGTRNGVIALE